MVCCRMPSRGRKHHSNALVCSVPSPRRTAFRRQSVVSASAAGASPPQAEDSRTSAMQATMAVSESPITSVRPICGIASHLPSRRARLCVPAPTAVRGAMRSASTNRAASRLRSREQMICQRSETRLQREPRRRHACARRRRPAGGSRAADRPDGIVCAHSLHGDGSVAGKLSRRKKKKWRAERMNFISDGKSPLRALVSSEYSNKHHTSHAQNV